MDNNHLVWVSGGLLAGVSLTLLVQYITNSLDNDNYISRQGNGVAEQRSNKSISLNLKTDIKVGVEELIGNTPLLLIKSLSKETQCTILAKAEFLNPGGSPKDRVAKGILEQAEEVKKIQPNKGYTIYEGTVGSTGISLAMLCRAKGYYCYIVMPDDMAEEKYLALEALGATVEKVRPASIVDPGHFVNVARTRALNDPKGFFVDQFENDNNFKVHQRTTGQEILSQTDGVINGFVAGAGTGGTLSGVAHALKDVNSDIIIALADPQGSGLFHKVNHGTLYTPEQSEGERRRHQVDTVVEGVGLTRLTRNLDVGLPLIDFATKVTDQTAVSMSRYLLAEDGLFVGSSSAVNCVGAVRLARKLGPGSVIVTLLCDSGSRHNTKFWSKSALKGTFKLDSSTPTDLSFVGDF